MDKYHFISEIKQFNVYYTLIMDQIKKSELGNKPEEIMKEDLRIIDKTKKELNEIYLSLLQDSEQSIVAFLDIVCKQVIENDTIPTSLLRIAIKTLTNIFEFVVNSHVHFKRAANEIYCP